MKISDFEKFKLNHNERQVLPYRKILNKYPSLRIYGFKSAVKQCFEDFDIPEITHYDLYECGTDLSDEDWEKLFDTPINECPYKKDHIFSKSIWYPPFLPDLHFVSENLILCIEVEDHARITKERQDKIWNWVLQFDSICNDFPDVAVLGFTRFGNFDWIIAEEDRNIHTAHEWLTILENTPV